MLAIKQQTWLAKLQQQSLAAQACCSKIQANPRQVLSGKGEMVQEFCACEAYQSVCLQGDLQSLDTKGGEMSPVNW